MKQKKLTILLICLLEIIWLNTASANIEIQPRFSLEEKYSDNINLSASNEEEDWITTVEPGISLLYNGRSIDATVDYSLSYKFYKNNSENNQDEFKDIQRAAASALFFSGRPFTLRISENISRETLDERDAFSDENDLVNKTTVYNLQVSPQYRLQLMPTFSLVLGYDYNRTDYVDSRGNDSEDHSGRVSLIKQLSSNTEISVNYTYKVYQSDDDEEEEHDEHSYTLGLNQQLGSRTSLAVEGGYSEIEYDSGMQTDSTTLLVDLSYHLTAPLTLILHYSQDYSVSATNGLTEKREANFIVAYVKNSRVAHCEVYWRNSDYVRLHREDDTYGARFDLSNPLAKNLTANFDAEYEFARFKPEGEDVDRITLGTSLDYEYRRLLVSLDYEYRINESDLDDNDYDNNIVTLRASVRF